MTPPSRHAPPARPSPADGEACDDPAICCPSLAAAALDEDAAEQLAAVLKALADPVRLRVVSIVLGSPSGEVCACDLPALLDRSQPTISHHLTQLVNAGILRREQRGKWAWFRVSEERMRSVRDALAPAAVLR